MNTTFFSHVPSGKFFDARRRNARAARDCALAPVATGGEPLSRPSFPGARFPEERGDAGAHSPGPYIPRCTSTAGREIHECVHYAVARAGKETSTLSSAITHGGHVAASSVRRDAMRCSLVPFASYASSNAFPSANTRGWFTPWPLGPHRACKDVTLARHFLRRRRHRLRCHRRPGYTSYRDSGRLLLIVPKEDGGGTCWRRTLEI